MKWKKIIKKVSLYQVSLLLLPKNSQSQHSGSCYFVDKDDKVNKMVFIETTCWQLRPDLGLVEVQV